MIGVNNLQSQRFLDEDTAASRRFQKADPAGCTVCFLKVCVVLKACKKLVRSIGADAVLIEKHLARAENKAAKLAELRGVL